ncbi:hypothetical protein RU98_GL002260 [Enterococcus caccae]|nr:hypothetical protein RU98_GL002260 [Enterococcus caccae]
MFCHIPVYVSFAGIIGNSGLGSELLPINLKLELSVNSFNAVASWKNLDVEYALLESSLVMSNPDKSKDSKELSSIKTPCAEFIGDSFQFDKFNAFNFVILANAYVIAVILCVSQVETSRFSIFTHPLKIEKISCTLDVFQLVKSNETRLVQSAKVRSILIAFEVSR